MAFDNPQPPKPKSKPQRPLTPQELETASGFTKRWNQSQLGLIWKRKMPADANLEDFQMFLYIVEQKELDPLLSEVYCQLRYNKDTGEQQLTVIDGIHGMMKSADKTGELNGVETTFDTDEHGNLISATTTVHRKNCQFPFRATAYVSEYDAKTFIWNTKKRVMIAKCSLALALRLAFAAALAGVYIAEEFERDDNRPAEDEHFEIGEIAEPEPESTRVVEHVDGDPRNNELSNLKITTRRLGPDVGTGDLDGHETVESVADKIVAFVKPEPAAAPPQEVSNATPPMPAIDYKEKNRALKQRVLKDLEISQALQAGFLARFFKGWIGSEDLPKDPSVYTPGWEELDSYQTFHHAEARAEFIADAHALGQKMKQRWTEKMAAGPQEDPASVNPKP